MQPKEQRVAQRPTTLQPAATVSQRKRPIASPPPALDQRYYGRCRDCGVDMSDPAAILVAVPVSPAARARLAEQRDPS